MLGNQSTGVNDGFQASILGKRISVGAMPQGEHNFYFDSC